MQVSFYSFLIWAILFSQSVSAKVLVYEYGQEGDGDNHGELVTQIACRNLDADCETVYSKDLSRDDLIEMQDKLEPGDVVNMSFVFQRPEELNVSPHVRMYNRGNGKKNLQEKYEEDLYNFNEDLALFNKVISEEKETLFVSASGNGYLIFGMSTPGVPLDLYYVYPAFLHSSNKVTVAALDTNYVDVDSKTDYRLTEYSNYSINHVDIAAPVEFSDEGSSLEGTSFAAPFVSRVSKKIMKRFDLVPDEVKSILLRSAFIENLEAAYKYTLEYNNEVDSSFIRRIEETSKKKVRDQLRENHADIMLVKSGGALVEDVASKCSEIYAEAKGVMTINQACLMAHESELGADDERQTLLNKFWKLRQIN